MHRRRTSRVAAVWVSALMIVALGACGDDDPDPAMATAGTSTSSPARAPTDLCARLSDAFAATPELGVDAGSGTSSMRDDTTAVCTVGADSVRLVASVTSLGGSAGLDPGLRSACALLRTTSRKAQTFSARSDACDTASTGAPGEVVSVSTLPNPAALLVLRVEATDQTGAILGAEVAKLRLAIVGG